MNKFYRYLLLSPAVLLAGCGGSGQDLGGFSRGLGGDLGSGYNSPISSRFDNKTTTNQNQRGVYPHLEGSFTLKVEGDPFDYETNDITVTLKKPDNNTVEVPAFFDGDDKTPTWRFRYTPLAPGTYTVGDIKRHKEIARADGITPKEFNVKGDPLPGFVRADIADKTRFVFDNGSRYYPLGHNQAWHTGGLPEIPEMFEKMKGAGENWSRVWMNHWDGKNLDWSSDYKAGEKPTNKLGTLDLEVARRWDKIIEAAQKNGIYFQMTLQHHGQYASRAGFRFSSNTDPNWQDNPWNAANGGFLKDPVDFFTDAQARKLTKRKYYYLVARYGYSPNILAWELFNEVENTDASRGKLIQDITMWHQEMAFFIRQYDGYHHLITTSAANGNPLDSPLWESMDYAQVHMYPSDIIAAVSGVGDLDLKKYGKPVFIGEFGPSGLADKDGETLHNGVWTSLMRNPSGAAQYWTWDLVEKQDLYSHFKAATAFLTASALANQSGLVSVTPDVQTPEKGMLSFGAGGGFGDAKASEFVVGAGVPAGFGAYPAFLQGENHRAMMPEPLTLSVNYAKPGTFTLNIGRVAKLGAKLELKLDGTTKLTRDFPAAANDYSPDEKAAALVLDIPTGAHKISVQNVGTDWVNTAKYQFSDYAPALSAFVRESKEYAVGWILHPGTGAVQGTVALPGLTPGKYRLTWWDTRLGKSLSTEDVTVTKAETGAELKTPPVAQDVAFYLTRAHSEKKPEKAKKGR